MSAVGDLLLAPDVRPMYVALTDVRAFEVDLYRFIETRHPQVFKDIATKKILDDATKASLDGAVKAFATEFAARKSAAA